MKTVAGFKLLKGAAIVSVAAAAVAVTVSGVYAFNTAQAGTGFFSEGYTFLNDTVLGGPIASIAGLGICGFALWSLFQHQVARALTSALVGIGVVNLNAIVTSLGVLF